ncbi:stalk domain-containing protein [Paenibacillus tengchongensis]|uniref:stalk domain-containing protein n=1 Tax=Paenibacillus tengchongensis TaxID=2608684 RepID=UPI00124E8293|nr:stalk domain-containing protein [Paenibacillus tengchongensis]
MKSKKMILATMAFGMAITGSAGVYAGTNLQKISAYLNHGIAFKVNGAAYTPVDNNGKSLAPITYNNTTYLPVRALADALDVPVTFDASANQVILGNTSGNTANGSGTAITLTAVQYSTAQKEQIQKAFAAFQGFETAYAPAQMISGDAFQKVSGGGDGVSFVFKHMNVNVSPRDYSFDYEGTGVKLANGAEGKWYTPSDVPMLTFNLDDRYVTVSSPDRMLSKAQLEKVAAQVAKLVK